jgi:hypothetical protein
MHKSTFIAITLSSLCLPSEAVARFTVHPECRSKLVDCIRDCIRRPGTTFEEQQACMEPCWDEFNICNNVEMEPQTAPPDPTTEPPSPKPPVVKPPSRY